VIVQRFCCAVVGGANIRAVYLRSRFHINDSRLSSACRQKTRYSNYYVNANDVHEPRQIRRVSRDCALFWAHLQMTEYLRDALAVTTSALASDREPRRTVDAQGPTRFGTTVQAIIDSTVQLQTAVRSAIPNKGKLSTRDYTPIYETGGGYLVLCLCLCACFRFI
jgi:hypothetical protein